VLAHSGCQRSTTTRPTSLSCWSAPSSICARTRTSSTSSGTGGCRPFPSQKATTSPARSGPSSALRRFCSQLKLIRRAQIPRVLGADAEGAEAGVRRRHPGRPQPASEEGEEEQQVCHLLDTSSPSPSPSRRRPSLFSRIFLGRLLGLVGTSYRFPSHASYPVQ
jgi:hypothetical protein